MIRGLGAFGIGLAASMLIFGYLIPVQFLTAIDNHTWTHAIPRLSVTRYRGGNKPGWS